MTSGRAGRHSNIMLKVIQLQIQHVHTSFDIPLCEHADTCPLLKHAHCLLYIPPFTSTLSASFIFTFSQLSATHHFKKKPFIMSRVCMCVNCRYKAALAWAQMKHTLDRGLANIGSWGAGRCFFWRGGQITVYVWRKSDRVWSTPAKARLMSTSNGIRNPYFRVKPDIWKEKNGLQIHFTLCLPTSFSLSCTVTLSFHLLGAFILSETLSVNT